VLRGRIVHRGCDCEARKVVSDITSGGLIIANRISKVPVQLVSTLVSGLCQIAAKLFKLPLQVHLVFNYLCIGLVTDR